MLRRLLLPRHQHRQHAGRAHQHRPLGAHGQDGPGGSAARRPPRRQPLRPAQLERRSLLRDADHHEHGLRPLPASGKPLRRLEPRHHPHRPGEVLSAAPPPGRFLQHHRREGLVRRSRPSLGLHGRALLRPEPRLDFRRLVRPHARRRRTPLDGRTHQRGRCPLPRGARRVGAELDAAQPLRPGLRRSVSGEHAGLQSAGGRRPGEYPRGRRHQGGDRLVRLRRGGELARADLRARVVGRAGNFVHPHRPDGAWIN